MRCAAHTRTQAATTLENKKHTSLASHPHGVVHDDESENDAAGKGGIGDAFLKTHARGECDDEGGVRGWKSTAGNGEGRTELPGARPCGERLQALCDEQRNDGGDETDVIKHRVGFHAVCF